MARMGVRGAKRQVACDEERDAVLALLERSTSHGKMPYFSVPADVRPSTRKLRARAKRSIDVALSA